MRYRAYVLVAALLLPGASIWAAELAGNLEVLRAVGPKGKGHAAAALAWKEVAQSDASQLTQILAALDGAQPLAANWIRAAVDTIAQRQMQTGRPLPLAALEAFVEDTDHSPQGRRLAFEWLARGDATAPDRLIPGMLHDPSVEFRRDAVERLLAEAKPLYDSKKLDAAAAIYAKAFSGARDLDQIKLLAERLEESGHQVDLPRHFGFLMQWKLIGPFDNIDKRGYPISYPPEKELDFVATYEGKQGTVSWIDHTSEDDYGKVDLNKALGKNMGAVGYAATTFESDRRQTVDLRLGCTNACKLWLGGKQLIAREVYHAGSGLDQYVAQGELQPGSNVIVVKVCQNEQTDSWAQDWAFQLRICDRAGTAIPPAKRR